MIYKAGQRVTCVGTTGSGKTTREIMLIQESPVFPIIIFDTKEDDAFLKAFPGANVLNSLSVPGEDDITIIRPKPEESADPDILDDFLYGLQKSRNTLICIDEAYMFHKNGQAGPGLLGLITRGRSRGITMITCSQRPAWVSRFVFTECEHFNVLKLRNPDDKRIMAQYTGYPDLESIELNYFEGIYTDGKIRERFTVQPVRPLPMPEPQPEALQWV